MINFSIFKTVLPVVSVISWLLLSMYSLAITNLIIFPCMLFPIYIIFCPPLFHHILILSIIIITYVTIPIIIIPSYSWLLLLYYHNSFSFHFYHKNLHLFSLALVYYSRLRFRAYLDPSSLQYINKQNFEDPVPEKEAHCIYVFDVKSPDILWLIINVIVTCEMKTVQISQHIPFRIKFEKPIWIITGIYKQVAINS